MNMSNNEKDEFIRKNLNNDRIIASGDEVKKKIKKDIDVSKIKQKKYTIGERRFMKFLSVVLVVSLASNAYLFKIKTNDAEPDSKTSKSYSASSNVDFPEIKDDIENESKYENVTNEMKNEISQIALIENKNTINENTVAEENNTYVLPETDINKEILAEELKNYCISIGRFGEDANDLEKNTILLLMANDFFNSKVSTNTGLKISSNNKYAMTADNVHKFIEELTGNKVEKYLNSYINYMKYNDTSKFYSSGEKSTELKKEKYEISNIEIISDLNEEYVLTADIHRKSVVKIEERNKETREEEIEADYTLNATVSPNNNYTYVPYVIKKFQATLNPGQQDNIDRLVDVKTEVKK